MSSLDSTVAIVTGSSSGLGEAIALKLVSLGTKVTLCGRDIERLKIVKQRAIAEAGATEDQLIIAVGDINNKEDRQNIIESTINSWRRLDILVLNAGISDVNVPLPEVTEEQYDNIMNTNLKSVFFLVQDALPHLEKSRGCIITISSILSAIVKIADRYVYSMSKAALDNLTESLAFSLGAKGIRVNSVNPSFIQTLIWRSKTKDLVDQKAKKFSQMEHARQPLVTERGVEAADVADAVAFLVSDAAAFITGQHFRIDGGLTMAGPFPLTKAKL